MGLLGLLFIVCAGVTAALAYFLKAGNVAWKSKAGCTYEAVCGQDTSCCSYWDSIDGDFGVCRVGTWSPDRLSCVPKSEALPLGLAVATVALLFAGLIVLLIPSGGGEGGAVALHLT